MISQLTLFERKVALSILFLIALLGMFFFVAGRGDPIAIHGLVVIVFCAFLAALVFKSLNAPAPSNERLKQYYDDPTKVGIILSIVWVSSVCPWVTG